MATIILINGVEYEVTANEAILAYYALKRKDYYCPIKDNLKLPAGNVKKVEFDCTQSEGQADCLHCGGNGIYENV